MPSVHPPRLAHGIPRGRGRGCRGALDPSSEALPCLAVSHPLLAHRLESTLDKMDCLLDQLCLLHSRH